VEISSAWNLFGSIDKAFLNPSPVRPPARSHWWRTGNKPPEPLGPITTGGVSRVGAGAQV